MKVKGTKRIKLDQNGPENISTLGCQVYFLPTVKRVEHKEIREELSKPAAST